MVYQEEGWERRKRIHGKKKTEEWNSLHYPPPHPLYTPAIQATCTVVSGDPLNFKSRSFRQNLVFLPNSMQITVDFNIDRNNMYAKPFKDRYLHANGHDSLDIL